MNFLLDIDIREKFIYNYHDFSERCKMAKGKLKAKPTWEQLIKEIREAQKDPEFVREVRKFIKATT